MTGYTYSPPASAEKHRQVSFYLVTLTEIGKHKHTPCTAFSASLYIKEAGVVIPVQRVVTPVDIATAPAGAHAPHMGRGPEQRADSSSASQAALSATDSGTLEAMLQFFLRHTAYAGQGWGAVDEGDAIVSHTTLNVALASVMGSTRMLPAEMQVL